MKSPRSGWASGFETLSKEGAWPAGVGNEDKWEFEEDTYALGLVAVTKRGLRGAAGPVVVALATPSIQLLAFFKIFEHLISESGESADPLHEGASFYVRLICFVLMSLSLSNEALEGFYKVVFCLRASGGIYADIKGYPCIGCLLSFIQFGMTIGSVGLSMLVVSEQTTALDAFMNFVALAFLTEIDNIVMSSRTIRNFVQAENQYEAVPLPSAFPEGCRTPWTVGMMMACNMLLSVSAVVMTYVYWITAEMSRDDRSFSIVGHLPSGLLCWLALNVVMWYGSKKVGAMSCSRALFLVCVAMDACDKLYLYTYHERLFSPFTMAVTFWFEFAGPVTAFAVEKDPFHFLSCPWRSPALVWSMLIQSVFLFDSLYRFGVD